MLLVSIGVSQAQANTTYYVYWDRAEVKQKAGVLTLASYLICIPIPSYLSFACGTGNAGVAFDFAASKDCKVRQRVTINSSSSYSFDRATHYYQPYSCLKR